MFLNKAQILERGCWNQRLLDNLLDEPDSMIKSKVGNRNTYQYSIERVEEAEKSGLYQQRVRQLEDSDNNEQGYADQLLESLHTCVKLDFRSLKLKKIDDFNDLLNDSLDQMLNFKNTYRSIDIQHITRRFPEEYQHYDRVVRHNILLFIAKERPEHAFMCGREDMYYQIIRGSEIYLPPNSEFVDLSHLISKPVIKLTSKQVQTYFGLVWDKYHYKKQRVRACTAFTKFAKNMTPGEIEAFVEKILLSFRSKNSENAIGWSNTLFASYLNGECWNDEVTSTQPVKQALDMVGRFPNTMRQFLSDSWSRIGDMDDETKVILQYGLENGLVSNPDNLNKLTQFGFSNTRGNEE